jgi:hypothetical protein
MSDDYDFFDYDQIDDGFDFDFDFDEQDPYDRVTYGRPGRRPGYGRPGFGRPGRRPYFPRRPFYRPFYPRFYPPFYPYYPYPGYGLGPIGYLTGSLIENII